MLGVLADGVVCLHLGWILFLAFGAVAGRRRPWMKWFHLAALAFAAGLTAGGWVCPLTHLEVWLRRRAIGDDGGYGGTFLGHYAERLVYLEVPRWAVLIAVVAIAACSIRVYAGGGREPAGGPEDRP